MFLERVKTPGIAQLSYIFGDKGQACVIDPRRDCHEYLKIAAKHNCQITTVLETHRNEDLITGSPILASYHGATVYHGPNADGEVEYAKTTQEGDTFTFGNLKVEVIETPGHTDDSVSYLLYDSEFDKSPAAIFTGDALFIGDVGRTDFYPERAREVAGLLYDSLQKIRRRASKAQLYPAHGAGSVCGDGMADREFSTVAHEFENNPMLQLEREEFIEKKVNEFHYQPPYFKLMEKLNLVGADSTPYPMYPKCFTWDEFEQLKKDDVWLIDVRGFENFQGAHIPGSLCLPGGMISAYGGWLIKPEDKMFLIAKDAKQAKQCTIHFNRIGYDHQVGYLAADMASIAAKGKAFDSMKLVGTDTVKERVKSGASDWTLLDVRKKTEVEESAIEGSEHHYLGKLNESLKTLDKNHHYTVMCGSGKRATVGASLLKMNGFDHVDVYQGSMSAWKKAGLPTTD